MPNKQPSFAERCARMHDAAQQLKEIADMVALEAIRMAARRSASPSAAARNRNGEPARAPPYQSDHCTICPMPKTERLSKSSLRAAVAPTAASLANPLDEIELKE
jgi:hypothetical protein